MDSGRIKDATKEAEGKVEKTVDKMRRNVGQAKDEARDALNGKK